MEFYFFLGSLVGPVWNLETRFLHNGEVRILASGTFPCPSVETRDLGITYLSDNFVDGCPFVVPVRLLWAHVEDIILDILILGETTIHPSNDHEFGVRQITSS